MKIPKYKKPRRKSILYKGIPYKFTNKEVFFEEMKKIVNSCEISKDEKNYEIRKLRGMIY
jgi:hypothetical protein